jgi:hypothetical protein
MPYFTDGSVLQPALRNCPTIVLGPGEPSQAHQIDEFCETEKILEAVTIYRALAEKWALEERLSWTNLSQRTSHFMRPDAHIQQGCSHCLS